MGGIGTNADGSKWEHTGQRRRFDRFADTSGFGLGQYEAVLDYSAAGGEDFYVEPNDGEVLLISRLIVSVSDDSFDSGAYGNVTPVAPLTNGITLKQYREGVLFSDLTAGVPIGTVGDWAARCHDLSRFPFGSGDEIVTARWTFTKASAPGTGTAIRLVGRPSDSDRLVVHLEDDFQHLSSHRFLFQGVYENDYQ